MNQDLAAERRLTLEDFSEPMVFPKGLVAPSAVLEVSCHWHEHVYAYVTLYDPDLGSREDFSIKQVLYTSSSNCHYMLLGLTPREAGDSKIRSFYIVRVLDREQVALLGSDDIGQVLKVHELKDDELCNLELLAAVLGPVPTWDELQGAT